MSFVERLVVDEASRGTILYDEHIVRYEFAQQFVPGKTVLDIACGSGYGAVALLQAGATKVIGVDADQEVITEARKQFSKTGLEFLLGDATAVPLEDSSIDVITSFETIEHIPNYEGYLRELVRVLTGEGVALISTPNRDVFGQKNPFHVKEFTKAEFVTTLKKYFQNVEVLEQKNGLASVITTEDQTGQLLVQDTTKSQPLYFIAVCAKQALPTVKQGVASINVTALRRWEANPGWRIVNSLYGWLQKIKLVK